MNTLLEMFNSSSVTNGEDTTPSHKSDVETKGVPTVRLLAFFRGLADFE